MRFIFKHLEPCQCLEAKDRCLGSWLTSNRGDDLVFSAFSGGVPSEARVHPSLPIARIIINSAAAVPSRLSFFGGLMCGVSVVSTQIDRDHANQSYVRWGEGTELTSIALTHHTTCLLNTFPDAPPAQTNVSESERLRIKGRPKPRPAWRFD